MINLDDLEDGKFYNISSQTEPEPILSMYHYRSEYQTFGLSFNMGPGSAFAGFIKKSDISGKIRIVEVEIIEK